MPSQHWAMQLDEALFAAVVMEAQLRVSVFKAPVITNTAYAFAKLGQRDEKLFGALAREAKRCASKFNAQDLANTA